jgi:hypothetical protein
MHVRAALARGTAASQRRVLDELDAAVLPNRKGATTPPCTVTTTLKRRPIA